MCLGKIREFAAVCDLQKLPDPGTVISGCKTLPHCIHLSDVS